ncbi:prephenate dehydratase domain-containing protein [Deinococcus sp.]|uniref:prephenate dehydratase domain-containing protein n=1 Tax=Deinococcus sp. TaxID=47478 RepID=UPI0025C4DA82|nr:prephenate dehydratase domain-containing protein [Deinococcus sp.]
MQKLILTTLLVCAAHAGAQSFLYLGPVGTYSDQVAQDVARAHGWTPTLASSITDVSNQVGAGKAPYGLIPIENSTGGYVAETLTLLAKLPAWRVIGISDLPIDNMLLVNPGTRAGDITTIVSHPQPFLQSANYLKANFPNVKRVEAKSTAAAAEQVAQDGGKTMAAIAAPAAAGVYKLGVLAARIQDDKANTTRFLVVQKNELDSAASADRAVVSYLPTRADGGLGLGQLLTGLRKLGFNVTGVASTPSGRLAQERLTLFLSGRATPVSVLQGAVRQTIGQATLLGAYTAEPLKTAAQTTSALAQACPDLGTNAAGAELLAQLTACRLDVAYEVAQAKYVSGAPVEDLAREAVVIDGGVKALPGVDDSVVKAYWAAQIEASKAAQRTLIDQWTKAGTPKFAHAPDLVTDVRPKLDALTTAISAALGEVWATRHCPDASLPAGSSQARSALNDYSKIYGAAIAPVTQVCQR